jgi:predicted amidohydrolase
MGIGSLLFKNRRNILGFPGTSFLSSTSKAITLLIILISFVLLVSGQTTSGIKGSDTIRIALAQIKRGRNIPEGVRKVDSILTVCRTKGVEIVCFPETYLPGLRGSNYDSLLSPPDHAALEKALKDIQSSCARNRVAAIIGMEWVSDAGLENRAFVISENGKVLGYQTKNQIVPGGEERYYVPGNKRFIFSIKEVPFGIVICHEGWRYPETVRWAALRGAKIVFQPQITGNNNPVKNIERPWGQSYYEMAMIMRTKENTIYFASVNECMTNQNSSTSLVDPDGIMIDYIKRGVEGLIIKNINLSSATGFYANRFHPERFNEEK